MKMWLVAFLALVIAVLNSSEHANAQEAISLYHSERGRFSVSLPSAWEKQEQDMGQGVWAVFALSPEEGTSDFFSENINIIIVPTDTTDLSEVNTRAIGVAKRNHAQFTLLDKAVGKIGPHSASWYISTFSYEGHTLKVVKYTLLNGSNMYLITCTALPETFERFRATFQNIVASIVFDEPATPRVALSATNGAANPATSQPDARAVDTFSNIGVVVGGVVGVLFLLGVFSKKKK